MVRFALFCVTGGSILTAAGLLPTPSSDEFPEFLKSNGAALASAPAQPALPADGPKFIFDVPQDKNAVQPVVIKRPVPRPGAQPVVPAVQTADADDGVALTLERLVATAGQAVQRVVEQRVSTEETPQSAELVASIVNFDHDVAVLDPFAEAKLDAMVSWLAQNPDRMVAVHGHTDLTGEEAYNDQLGLVRAEMVADYLIDNGIASDRIASITSFGETAPLVQTAGEARENRRVLIQTIQSL